ncbi:MAG TPA: hypothetical protein VFO41_16830 [Alphaproteobacteria bacterium]|nr:hypothetical protein [Alphaproteobacteria bacterium]
MQAVFQGVITEIERLSLEFSLIGWHATGAVRAWARRRISGLEAFEVAFETRRGLLTVTILPRDDRWCVYHSDKALLVVERFPRMVEALRFLIDQDEKGTATVH